MSQVHGKIRPISAEQFAQVKDLPPPEWGTDLSGFLKLHHGQSYFQAWVVEHDGRIIAFGNSLCNGITGWLGNILVAPEARGRGIGTAMTKHLMDDLRRQGCRRLLLVATPLGEPIYTRLGFRVTSGYAFYRVDAMPKTDRSTGLRPLAAADTADVLKLDRRITGEDRQTMLGRFLAGGWVIEGGNRGGVMGYFLPGLATGPVIACDEEAGLALLRVRLSVGAGQCVVPEANECARRWLEQIGAVLNATAPRMAWGREAAWQPESIFQRGAGWCG